MLTNIHIICFLFFLFGVDGMVLYSQERYFITMYVRTHPVVFSLQHVGRAYTRELVQYLFKVYKNQSNVYTLLRIALLRTQSNNYFMRNVSILIFTNVVLQYPQYVLTTLSRVQLSTVIL